MLSVAVQLIAWKDRPRNDLLCVERDVKQLLTHSQSPKFLIYNSWMKKNGRCVACWFSWTYISS